MDPQVRRAFVATLFAAGLAVGCGEWAPPAPTAPTQFHESPAAGVTISGTVSGGGSTGSPLLAATGSGLTVTVLGTNISAPVNTSGKFNLTGVPAGSIFLRFTGPGVDVTVLVGTLDDRDLLDIAVRIQAGSATIESRVRIRFDNTTEIEGSVAAVSGTCPNLVLKVHGWTLNLNGSSAGSCADVRVGVKIKIKGNRAGSVIIVIKIEIDGQPTHRDNDDADDDDDDD